MKPIRIAIIGFGKIAADSHVPAIRANPRFELVATSSRSGQGAKRCFTDWRELIRSVEGPRSGRDHHAARPALRDRARMCRRRPPLPARKAADRGVCRKSPTSPASPRRDQRTLYTTWHAQHHPAVDAAAKALAGKRIASLEILWHEDVHKWHPGQAWIWEPGGFGVFDPGINAFSIATEIFPGGLYVESRRSVRARQCANPDRSRRSFSPAPRPTAR